MKIKLFASDLDGTLLNEQHKISQQSADAIRTAQQTGKVFLAVTGRAWGTASLLLKEAGISCVCFWRMELNLKLIQVAVMFLQTLVFVRQRNFSPKEKRLGEQRQKCKSFLFFAMNCHC